MRNLKKFLALVLAMMMTFSLMVTVNAATASDFTDAESITDEFAEAIAVLEGLEVFEGYPDGSFKPKASISRAEVATIVYRLATGDVDGNQAHLYKDYDTFTDVKSDHWAAGYINYCANAEWINGYGNGKFGPNDNVTGYQAAAMILRAVGYGKNNEFTGPEWRVQAANFSRTLGLLTNVNNTSYASTLNQAATRELVAEILFQAGLINTVYWNPVYGYQSGDSSVQSQGGKSRGLAWQNFKLDVGDYQVIDKWGNPGYYWFKNTNTSANRVATIKLDPTLDLENKAWKECDVAHELGIKDNDTFVLYVNNYQSSTTKYTIEATDTVTSVGGQGRITKFYGNTTHPYKDLYVNSNLGHSRRADWSQSVTMVDTYLAKVTRVTERVLDRQGHVITPAYLYLDVYDGHGVGASAKTGVFFASGSAAEVNTTEHRLSNKTADWSYTAGEMVLVQGYTDKQQYENATNAQADNAGFTKADKVTPTTGSFAGTTKLNHTGTQAAIEKSAFEPNCLKPADSATTKYYWDEQPYTTSGSTALEVVGKATMKTGKQTVTYWSEDKHTVDGSDYNDAMTLYLDVAGTKTGTTFAWYFDNFGNLIGIDNVPNTINYGVIESIYSAFVQGENNTTGAAKAVANVKYADGSTGTITIDRFLVSGTYGTWGSTATHTTDTKMDGTTNVLDLVPVYDNSTAATVMTTSARANATVANQGWLHVAPVTNVNAIENGQQGAGTGYFGVLRGNLYKFVASSDGSMTAIEVAGKLSVADRTQENTGIYAGHYNHSVTAGSKLYKNLGYIDYDGDVTADVRLDSGAIIMIRANATAASVACYNMDNLPGDVTLDATTGSEVDWVDTDGNGRADYVYVTGTTVGTQTYGLFYYNGGAAQWNGVAGTGTLTGYLNGELATLTFQGESTFNAVRDSQDYAGHLFAVELTNGVVSALMRDPTNAERLLTTGAITPTGAFTTFTRPVTATNFQVGTVNGNPYDANTKAVYMKDVTTTPAGGSAEAKITYSPTYNTVVVDAGATYYLNPNSKVVGLGMGVTEDGAILDYLNKSTTNDVTIVYDDKSNAIVEIYVATDPNVTPDTSSTKVYTYSWDVNSTNMDLTVKQWINGVLADGTTPTVTANIYVRPVGTTNTVGTYVKNVTLTKGSTGEWTATNALVNPSNSLLYCAEVFVDGSSVGFTDSTVGHNA